MERLLNLDYRSISSPLSVFAATVFLSVSAFAQTTAFTYQGRLTDTLVAANGPYDMQFSLFDASAGGTQQGMTQTVLNVNVVAGIFTVSLDFGDQFDGNERHLLISVKKPVDPGYTPLAPRQQITSAPYAIRARTVAPTAGNTVIAALNDGSTNTVINDNVLPANLVRIKPAAQQTSASANNDGADALVNLRGTSLNSGNADFRIYHGGTLVSTGFVRDVGNTTGCANQLPITGAGTRFMWFPCRGSLRFGRVPTAQTNWDDANMDDFTFAGGNQVVASGYGAFAFGDQVTASSTVGVGFGSSVTVSGTAGFSAGASNVCSGFACTAIGYNVSATGQGSTALGYRTHAKGDYTTALGYRAATCSGVFNEATKTCSGSDQTGAFVWGDESTTSYVQSQAVNEFRIRANGGIRLRVSTAANGNTPGAGGNVGCDLTVAVPSWTCASSRDVKENFKSVGGEDVLTNLRGVPFMTFNYINDKSLTRNFGPMAEDFFKAFKLGDNDKSINVQNLASISLAGVKALEERTVNLQKENDKLRSQLTTLEARLLKLEQTAAKGSTKRRR